MRGEKTKYACRVFFEELSKSDFFIKENGRTFIITPTCARCNRLFGVGEVEEVEKRGDITKIRINDLTTSLNIYTNKQFITANTAEKRAFIAFIGNLHARGGGGNVIILAEEVEVVEENVRNNGILTTAQRTMERIELLRKCSFEWQSPSIAEGNTKKGDFSDALKHYAIYDDKLDELVKMVIKAVKGVWRDYSKTTGGMILEILENTKCMKQDKLIKKLMKKGLEEAWIEEVINELIEGGRCYTPEAGVLEVVEG
jgi:RPA family protein